MPDPQHLVQLSKTLSYILRHDPGKFGLTLDAQGWCVVDELLAALAAKGTACTRDLLETVVEQNDKKRFAFSPDGAKIRASQGHSLPVELGYTPATPPALLFHGTTDRFLDSILKQGLQKRQRHHVHLSADAQTAVAVGQRHGRPVVLTVQAGRMAADGYLFYRSANGVWLTDAVPPAYLSRQPAKPDRTDH